MRYCKRLFLNIQMNMRSQGVVTMLLLYAAYVTHVCPCAKTLSCHLPQFYGAVGASVAFVFLENM